MAPIDATPNHEGNIVISLGAGVYRVVPNERLAIMQAEGGPLYTNHFQTCSAAAVWKRPGRSGGSGMRGPRKPSGPQGRE